MNCEYINNNIKLNWRIEFQVDECEGLECKGASENQAMQNVKEKKKEN